MNMMNRLIKLISGVLVIILLWQQAGRGMGDSSLRQRPWRERQEGIAKVEVSDEMVTYENMIQVPSSMDQADFSYEREIVTGGILELLEKTFYGYLKAEHGKSFLIQYDTGLSESLTSELRSTGSIKTVYDVMRFGLEALLNNAYDAIIEKNEDGMIQILVKITKNYIQAEVTDDGVPIPIEEHPILFEDMISSHKPDLPENRFFGKAGQALFFLSKMIGILHGRVDADNYADMGGATVQFGIPVISEPGATAMEELLASRPSRIVDVPSAKTSRATSGAI